MFDCDYKGKSRFPYKATYEVVKDNGDMELKEVLVPRLVNSIDEYKLLRSKTNWPYGTAFVIDEAQAIINSRDFMSRKNKDVIKLLSTGRIFRSYTFINLPYWEHLDNQIKSYLHAVIKVHRPDRQKNLSRWTPYLIRPQGFGKPPLTYLFRRRNKLNNRIYYLEGATTPRPSASLDRATQQKTLIWKQAMHQGLVSASGNILNPVELKAQEMANIKPDLNSQAVHWANELKDVRKDFLKGERYVLRKIQAAVANIGGKCSIILAEMISMQWVKMDAGIEPTSVPLNPRQ